MSHWSNWLVRHRDRNCFFFCFFLVEYNVTNMTHMAIFEVMFALFSFKMVPECLTQRPYPSLFTENPENLGSNINRKLRFLPRNLASSFLYTHARNPLHLFAGRAKVLGSISPLTQMRGHVRSEIRGWALSYIPKQRLVTPIEDSQSVG